MSFNAFYTLLLLFIFTSEEIFVESFVSVHNFWWEVDITLFRIFQVLFLLKLLEELRLLKLLRESWRLLACLNW